MTDPKLILPHIERVESELSDLFAAIASGNKHDIEAHASETALVLGEVKYYLENKFDYGTGEVN